MNPCCEHGRRSHGICVTCNTYCGDRGPREADDLTARAREIAADDISAAMEAEHQRQREAGLVDEHGTVTVLGHRAWAMAAELSPKERAFVVWAHGEGEHVASIIRTDLGRAVAAVLAEGKVIK